jgi:hypothetical protein
MDTELKPCPFCNEELFDPEYTRRSSDINGMRHPINDCFLSGMFISMDADGINGWNTRAETKRPQPDGLEAAARICDKNATLFDTHHNDAASVAARTCAKDIRAIRQPLGVVVPLEPTEAMIISMMEADCLGRPSVDDDTHVKGIYKAALLAAGAK